MVSMGKKTKRVVVDENEGLELDPQLWQGLPEDLLPGVIAKLPFARVVAFRRVCKQWRWDIIPRAACHVEASNKSTLVYFDFLNRDTEKSEGCKNWVSRSSLCWIRICNATSYSHEFSLSSFPSPSNDEVIKLKICEQGLLFFCLMTCGNTPCFLKRCRQQQIVRDIVVCNPLTSQTKILGLPGPLRPPCMPYPRWQKDAEVLLGTVFDSKTRSYRLVAAGVDAEDQFVTFLYDSLTSSWTNGHSLLPALSEVWMGVVDAHEVIEVNTRHSRVVCCNSNLYWYVLVKWGNLGSAKTFVLEFDIQPAAGAWRFIRTPRVTPECRTLGRLCQLSIVEGEILLLHVHRDLSKRQCSVWRMNHVMDRPCSSGLKLNLAPEIKWIQQDMMDRGNLSFSGNGELYPSGYRAFSYGNCTYHVLRMCSPSTCSEQSIKIVVQDTTHVQSNR